MPRHIHIDYSPGVKPVTVDLEASVSQPGGKVTELFNELVAHHKRQGLDEANAKEAAYQELADLYRMGHGHFRDYYVRLKGGKLDVALLVEHQALTFYDQAMRGPGPVDAAKLRVILQRTSSVLDELAIPARKIVDDVEASRAAQGLRNLEAVRPTPLKESQRADPRKATLMPPHEKLGFLSKEWTVGADGRTATFKSKAGTGTAVATITMRDGVEIAEVTVTLTGEQPVTIREGDVLQRHDAQPTPHGNLVQSHHPVQNALCRDLCASLGIPYDGNAMSTIWVRDSTPGSPHNRISGLQSGRTIDPPLNNFGALRDAGVADLKAAGYPDAWIQDALRAFDNNFETIIMPEIRKKYPNVADQDRFKGTFKEYY